MLIFLLAAIVVVGSSSAIPTATTNPVQCLNEKDGDPVDWWFIYKQPNGCTFAYYDSQTTAKKFVISDSFLNRTSSGALASTLNQLYRRKSSLAFIGWNDEFPKKSEDNSNSTRLESEDGPSNDDAHSKGVIVSDGDSGFWLVHSVPAFPDLSLSSFDWTASTIYGQSLLCISMDAKDTEDISELLQYAGIGIFQSNMPSNLKSELPNMQALMSGTTKDGSNHLLWTSQGGNKFTSFYKSESWGKDLYEDLVSPTLKLSFLWETWRRSPAMPSYCKDKDHDYDSLNIQTIDFTHAGGTEFSYTKDHCKWGISEDSSNPWICVGGINRMSSQRNRGGGTSCFVHGGLYSALNDVIAKHDTCSGQNVVEIDKRSSS